MPEPRSTLTVPGSQYDGASSPRSLTSLTSPSGSGIRRKLVVIGDGACGKTSLLISYTNGTFPVMYVPTVFENYVANIQVDNHLVEMSLWDTAGQEDYDRLRPLSYPETSVIVICFAIDMPNSLASVTNKWIDEVVQYCDGVPRILVGCKSDLRKSGKEDFGLVTAQQVQEVAQKIEAYRYVECSAKSGEGLAEVFEQAARASLLARKKSRKPASSACSKPPAKPKSRCAVV